MASLSSVKEIMKILKEGHNMVALTKKGVRAIIRISNIGKDLYYISACSYKRTNVNSGTLSRVLTALLGEGFQAHIGLAPTLLYPRIIPPKFRVTSTLEEAKAYEKERAEYDAKVVKEECG